MKRVLTGIQPTGSPHIGNLLGAIKPLLEKQEENQQIYAFIADYHALTSISDPKLLKQLTMEVTLDYLALGLDPNKVTLYRQSEVPQVCELAWILSCQTNLGLLQRAHAFKDAQTKNKSINHGVFAYPVLMAADILLMQSEIIPVGKDQKQHVEIARDLAIKFNNKYSNTFKVPEPEIKKDTQTILGFDGQKMSKSYNNTIPIFTEEKKLRKLIMKIQTNSQTPEEPKDHKGCMLFDMYSLFASKNEITDIKKRYKEGIGWGDMKQILFESINDSLREARKKRETLLNNIDEVEKILKEGEKQANITANKTLTIVRKNIGLNNIN